MDIRNWALLDIVAPCLQDCLQHAILFIGMSGIGKTPMACAMAMSISKQFCIELDDGNAPSFQIASDLDFFRQVG